MNIILVGATGYWGSKILLKLKKEKHNILCVMRNSKLLNNNYIYLADNFSYKLNLFNHDLIIYTACVYKIIIIIEIFLIPIFYFI